MYISYIKEEKEKPEKQRKLENEENKNICMNYMNIKEILETYFFAHLRDKNISYIEHLKMSLNFSLDFILGSGKAIIHAFIPGLYSTSTSDTIERISEFLHIKAE